jgi:hypothetical protein
MSRFRKVDGGTWGDARFVGLSQDAKFLWLYLITGPHGTSLPGLFTIGRSALAEALGWTTRRLDTHIAELAKPHQRHQHPMLKVDWKSRVMWLPNAAKHNRPTHPRTIDGWRGHVACIPECALKHEALDHIRPFVTSWGKEYLLKFETFAGSSAKTDDPSPSEPSVHQVDEPSSKQSHQPPLSTAPSISTSLSSEGVQGESRSGGEPRRIPRGEWELHRAIYVAAYERAVREASGNPRWSMRKPEVLWSVLHGCCINEDRGDIEGWIDRHAREVVRFIQGLSAKDSEYWKDFGPAELQRWFNRPERGLKPAAHRPSDRDSKTRLKPTSAEESVSEPVTPEERAAFEERMSRPPRARPLPMFKAPGDDLPAEEVAEAERKRLEAVEMLRRMA